ncbi:MULTISPECIES: hypothetical protein [Methylorubrum]|uniref:hypothetical protein n=1 Tax=Methylorubrum TaxID=2282523 RepID=UPI00209F516A|nr:MULTISPECIES: hypothetical protein [Methylorubrum]MCP1548436.1 hypothetical protein [Methylorubrum zatmanii]MCP1554949.1 hypothetical protein [Methylorubrum extorquens]MCP1578739.1 hypothetical protein [Methylorubrum extorquens]
MGFDWSDTDPDRHPAPKWGGASVGSIGDPFRGFEHTYESEPERAVLTVLISLPGVLRIREQRTVKYRMADVDRPYTFDIHVDWVGGVREVIAVRQTTEGLLGDETVEIVKTICAQHGSRLADDYRAVTYETLDPFAVLNGRDIIECGRDRDEAGKAAIRKALPGLGPVTTLREVAMATGLGPRGVRAAKALLQSGILMNPPGKRLDLDLELGNRISGRSPREQ